jgi:hypothetical protein
MQIRRRRDYDRREHLFNMGRRILGFMNIVGRKSEVQN